MHYRYLHPRDQILDTIDRIYQRGMTTTSGGNISIRDADGAIWITPAGIDKGSLVWEDIVKVELDGTLRGRHRPSSEYPFHKAIYEARPDLGAIVHAHPTALVAYSIVRRVPPTRIIPPAYHLCRNVGFAPYALPGSDRLGANIAETFAGGSDSVILENHGVVCGGGDLLEAFSRFETLEFCGRLAIKGHRLGRLRELEPEQVELRNHRRHYLPEFDPVEVSSEEKALRRHIGAIVRRAYQHQLMTSSEGVVSARLDDESFLITPTGMDRLLVEAEDIVLIRKGQRERGKLPSRSVVLHERIYRDHPWVRSIITAQPPSSAAFCLTDEPFNTRTIPESYILLRDIPTIPFGFQYTDEGEVSKIVGREHPVLLIQNEAVLAVGASLLEAYDRLEVAEFSANSLIDALAIGKLVEIGDAEIEELKRAFLSGR